MADAIDSKSIVRKGVWVRLPPPALLQRPGTMPGFCLSLAAMVRLPQTEVNLMMAGCGQLWVLYEVLTLALFRATL